LVVPREDPDRLAAATLTMFDAIAAGTVDRKALRTHIVASFSMVNLIDRTESALAQLLQSTPAPAARDVRKAEAR
jgi:hypothetical protein